MSNNKENKREIKAKHPIKAREEEERNHNERMYKKVAGRKRKINFKIIRK
jgi:hypothetical protein